MMVRLARLAARTLAVATLVCTAVIAIPQTALADPCPDGTARVFTDDATHRCQSGGSVTYTASPAVVKVCAMSRTTVVIDTDGRRKADRRHVELEPRHCAKFERSGQRSATVLVQPK